ncbi:MAG: penicillin acylase family protein, partial [Candidatus Hydrogenedentota bacterium]
AALPAEFRLLGYRPEPWQPSDTLAISRLLAWQLSKNFKSEIVMMKLVARLGAERAAELGPAYPSEGPCIIPAGAISVSPEDIEHPVEQLLFDEGTHLLDEIIGSTGGSNSWVIGPALSRNNAPLLANDPHLSGTRMPSLWYYIHLVGGGYDVIGGMVPGIPLPLLGHNRRIGWGMTNMNADVQDIFIERINPADPKQYEYDGTWVDMDTRVERIYFRTDGGDQSFIEKEVRRTLHGPLVNEVVPGVAQPISLSWTGFEPTAEFDALPGINLAGDWDEFCRALSNFTVAPQNFIYADIEGNIGYYGAGIIPVRSTGDGTIPQRGWTSESTWKDRIPFEELPHVLNPPAGYIATANNRVAGDEYRHLLSAEWAPRFRYQRIVKLIESKDLHDEESVAQMQSDTKSMLAELLLVNLIPALNDLSDPAFHECVGYLKKWDFDNTTGSVAATIYHEFLLKFAKNTFVDEMGEELAREYLDDYYLWIERFVRFVQQGSHWFDNVRTNEVETRDDIAVLSFRETVTSLQERFGSDPSKWRWSREHKLEFRHPLERSRLAKMLFNYGPFPFPGDGESINRGTFGFNEPYGVTMAASLRHIMDFSRLNRTLAVHTTGQSGNPVSHHYHDFSDLWLKGEYITMMMDREDFTDGVEGHLRLTPVDGALPR